MAKAKKSESTESAPKPAAKKPAKAKAAPQVTGSTPMIDTGLAAESAAKFLVARLNKPGASSGTPSKESASFKHLKESMSSTSNSMSNMLDKTALPSQKKSNTPFQGNNQTGRNQTFGADVNRSGVPRRTGGG